MLIRKRDTQKRLNHDHIKKVRSMAKKIKPTREDILYPLPSNLSLNTPSAIGADQNVQKQIIRQVLQAAYRIKEPEATRWNYQTGRSIKVKPVAIVTDDQVELVMSIMQSLQPQDTVETLLAAQFAIMSIRGMPTHNDDTERSIRILEFSHSILGVIQRYRNKGMQQINVQYNVNQGNIVNVKT